MSTIYMDGFDHYGSGANTSSTMTQGAWASTNTTPIGVPLWGPARTGAFCLRGEAGQDVQRFVLPVAKDRLFISFGYAIDTLPTMNDSHWLVSFRDNTNTMMTRLSVESTGQISLRNVGGTVLTQTAGPVIVAKNWHFIEMEYDRTGGKFILRVDDATGSGTPAINGSSLSLGSNSIAQMCFCGTAFATQDLGNHWEDDLFIRDASGSVNNGWLGDRRVATIFANADTTTSGWTPRYYKEFGAGILSLSTMVAGNNSPQNNQAYVIASANPQLDIGAADFTLETFVRFDALPTAAGLSTIFERWDTSTNKRSYRFILGGSSFNGGCLQFDTTTDGTAATLSTKVKYPWTPSTNTWYHLALVRVSGQLMLFVNGAQLGLPINDSTTYYSGGSEVFSIGNEFQPGGIVVNNTYLCGRLDETRFTNGTGRYNAPFSPPVAAFPRGISDPNWAQVVLLCGYDSAIVDESSFARTLTANNGAIAFLPSDGPSVGVYSTVNKANPDDNTFISAPFTAASNILTMTTQPSNGNTVTIATKNGSTPSVYTFKTAITTSYDVLIDTTAQNTLMNLLNAINAGAGIGTKYGTGTLANFDVVASQLPVGQILVTAIIGGTAGNALASTATGTAATWPTTTLTGGVNIPGPTIFKLQRPDIKTTLISAIQTNFRALKTDAGTGTVQTTFIGPLGGTAAGSTHPLSTSVSYYRDILETDPDTAGPLSPSTIINGSLQINRTV